MVRSKRIVLCALSFFIAIAMGACTCKCDDNPIVTTITVNGRSYEEVAQEVVEKLNLSVDSCSDLTALGETVKYSEIADYGTAYVYPDARYPNLAVAQVDGKPTVFQFCNFTGWNADGMDEIGKLYGLLSEDAIKEIKIRKQQQFEQAVDVLTVTEPEALAAFSQAAQDLEYSGQSLEKESDYFPGYSFEISLSNGFSCTFNYYPKTGAFYTAMAFYHSEAMLDWVKSLDIVH